MKVETKKMPKGVVMPKIGLSPKQLQVILSRAAGGNKMPPMPDNPMQMQGLGMGQPSMPNPTIDTPTPMIEGNKDLSALMTTFGPQKRG